MGGARGLPVRRFVVRVKPSANHPEYFEWQTLTAVLFVGDWSRASAQCRADGMIHANNLQRMSFSERSTLIPGRVRREGGKVLEAYLQARDGTPFLLLSPDHPPFVTKKTGPALCPAPDRGIPRFGDRTRGWKAHRLAFRRAEPAQDCRLSLGPLCSGAKGPAVRRARSANAAGEEGSAHSSHRSCIPTVRRALTRRSFPPRGAPEPLGK